MSRFAQQGRVFFFEEPVWEPGKPHLRSATPATGIEVLVPVLPPGLPADEVSRLSSDLLEEFIRTRQISNYVLWLYSPMALDLIRQLTPLATVYDCMDELSNFAGAAPEIRAKELKLFRKADLVFTGGASLFQAKKHQHDSVHLFPSSVDVAHFRKARTAAGEPEDQANIGFPRLGFAGVVDERMDLKLVAESAAIRPDWQFVFIGPVVKIDPATLPRAENIHYLGMKLYAELPKYFAGWQAGLLPFALNDSTRFISPTKTPEYLAAGLPVVSTPISDVVTPYGSLGLAQIVSNAQELAGAMEQILSGRYIHSQAKADEFLASGSWDKTWAGMNGLIQDVMRSGAAPVAELADRKDEVYV